MSLTKQKGNMYTWVTHMHSHLGGKCTHECKYCYVQRGVAKLSGKYAGEPRLIEKELEVSYGRGKTIFIEHMNDLFAEGVKNEWITEILAHCRKYPGNAYVFQTKNPRRCLDYFDALPGHCYIGTTIETNRTNTLAEYSKAPSPLNRASAMSDLAEEFSTFFTIEPIMDFDVIDMMCLIELANPMFVNIGADSKNNKLPEPSAEKIEGLIKELECEGIEVREKHNLGRILGNDDENGAPR